MIATLDSASVASPTRHVKAEEAMVATPSISTPAGHRPLSGEKAYYRFSDITFEVSKGQNKITKHVPQQFSAHSGTKSSLLIKRTHSNRFSATKP